ncbi:hypothetical protein CCHL11_06010 [Colletotrichum chlorophyti]|uniref:Uncharacterized protein n=1 Tax=Colletotrichum chlorophyti TaxID=708187 RepID=A0A1Q8RWL2_9PEZI|nr:hypothetical protein CCHL11_06010 [Colletotrichum chlorophyti]
MTSSQSRDDTFELYDLRVEVICPPGKRIMCGAKEGDYFTLKGEMLYLPPNQGISIYSLALLQSSNGPHASPGKATSYLHERLDDNRRTYRLPGPVLSFSIENYSRGNSDFSPFRDYSCSSGSG